MAGKSIKNAGLRTGLSKRSDDAGFTYVELMIAFMLLLLLLPALFFIAHAFETNLKTFVGQQELQLEYMAFRPLVERDIAQAIHIVTMEGGVLELIHPDGKAVRYQTSNRQVIRRVKEAGANRFSGATVVLRHVYYMGFHPERRGVRLDMGLQNWLADLDIKIFIAGRMGVHHAADR
ncbi:hypothetical protein [Laceyella sacchari]|uniref:Prepilin-type N-terminal cleavage/methylation domain-containing protein n=1 Tax=Laceyella sacchari TaxID=37482 RepID=A0ABY5U2D7_LACSH|nr:hypothetical protein [Laceyella sacchari]TCW37628.1 hypothetical protein EDC32_103286 [Laceyella sacchari]UWE02780.1 hypothetical protein NYR52_11620 [Laceyella sacchari]